MIYKDDFLPKIQKVLDEDSSVILNDGYFHYRKHLFVDNFLGMEATDLRISKDNYHALQTGYVNGKFRSLWGLQRWFVKDRLT